MSNEVVKGRGGLWRMVEVGGIAAAAGGFFLIGLHHPSPTFTNLHRPPVADIHTEYVKFPSGRDTITAYLAYPERKDPAPIVVVRSEEHTSELQSQSNLVCRLLLEKKKKKT